MNEILKKAIKQVIEKKKEEQKDEKIWLQEDIESLQRYRKIVASEKEKIIKLREEIFTLEIELKRVD